MPKGYKLTVRQGPEVDKEKFFSLDLAMHSLEGRAAKIVEEERASGVDVGVRQFEPGEQVLARLEVRGPKLLRGPRAGIDVKGDGELVPYRGRVLRRKLEAGEGESAQDAIREVLRSKKI